jgi:hypothetical protein
MIVSAEGGVEADGDEDDLEEEMKNRIASSGCFLSRNAQTALFSVRGADANVIREGSDWSVNEEQLKSRVKRQRAGYVGINTDD